MILRLVTICCALLMMASLFAQRSVLLEEISNGSLIGSSAEEYLNAAIPANDGNIAAVGFASRSEEGIKDDLLFILADATTLEKRSLRFIGRAEKDEAYTIANRPDGGFLVAGYSTTISSGDPRIRQRYHGGKDAWLLWLNARGETEAELLLGGTEDDDLCFIHPLSDSTWLGAGNKGNYAWLTKFSGGKQQQLLWEKKYQYQKAPTRLTAAAANANGQLLLTGYIGDETKGKLWLMGTDSLGKPLFNLLPLGDEMSWANGATALPDGQWAIVGKTDGVEKRGDGLLVIIDSLGHVIKRVALGGREFDHFTDVALDPRGDLLLLGESVSHQRGARRPKNWILRYSIKSGEVKEENFFGSKLEEQAKHISLQHDGSWIVAGSSSQQLLKNRQAALWRIGEWQTEESDKTPKFALATTSVPPTARSLPIQQLPGKGWHQNGLILRLRQQAAPGKELSLAVAASNLATANNLWLPLEKNMTGEWALGIYDENNRLLGREKILQFGRSENTLPLAGLSVQSIEGNAENGKVIKLSLQIDNNSSEEQAFRLELTPSPHFSSIEEIRLPTIAANGELFYDWPLRLQNVAELEPLHFKVYNSQQQLVLQKSIDLQDLTHLDSANKQSPQGTLVISWLNPNSDLLERPELVWNEANFTIQIKIISSHRIERSAYSLSVNGQVMPSGEKMDEVQFAGDDFSKTVTQQIQLREGKNTLAATATNSAGQATTDTITLIYEPSKPNLHLLSIGVPSYNLNYTTHDARDVAALFTQYAPQSAFGHIFMDTLLRPETTTKTAILKSLRRLNYRMEKRQINPQDVLLVFISSHGITDQSGHFRIAASDYDQPFMEETSIQFSTEFKEYLDQIHCRKIFLLDACHSGQAIGQADRADLNDFLAPTANINMMLSCQADEYSYEDDSWQNGAFTEAMISVVEDFMQSPSSAADINQDGQLSLLELYKALGPRANALSQKKRPKVRTAQNPVLNVRPELGQLILFNKPK